jgi:hypothetical protein
MRTWSSFCTTALFATFAVIAGATAETVQGSATRADADKTLIPHEDWTCLMPEGIPRPEDGTLVFEVEVTLDQIYDVGRTPYGQRHALVTQGGTVRGNRITASVLSLGLDYQLLLPNGVVEVEQVLMFRTEDNRYVYLRNAGVGTSESDVRVVLDIEAPNNSTVAWLNTGKYVARRTVDLAAKRMTMKVYDVAAVVLDPAKTIAVTKAPGVPSQPWDYRVRGQAETNGELLVTENVTLAGSQSVGASKRGNRNVIPITGGRLTGGLIPGEVLPGGADYQNFSAPPTIDARYLWKTTGGDIIIVRNTGGFGGLVPTFEVRTDSRYAWLNSGRYLSSNPGVGAGGVSLTFYKVKD